MSAKAYVTGHEIIADTIVDDVTRSEGVIHLRGRTGPWRYADTGEPFTGHCDRPCVRCGEHAAAEGHDPCIANLPGVTNACCGHGVQPGYISFADGRTIRGIFAIENTEPIS